MSSLFHSKPFSAPMEARSNPMDARIREKEFAPELVYLVTQMLEAVLDSGTGKAARAMGLNIPAAGKTGTSENFQDAWFVGYTTNLVCGVWVGYDIPKSLGHSAAGIALPLLDEPS